MGGCAPRQRDQPHRACRVAGGCCVGSIHAGFSIYWSTGGTWLVWSLGSSLQASFQGWEWVLAPIGLVKLNMVVGNLVLAGGNILWFSLASSCVHPGGAPTVGNHNC